jgi:hypothetical protein
MDMEQKPSLPAYPLERKELLFGLAILCASLVLANFTIVGGFNLGFSIGMILCLLCSVGYLLSRGYRPNGYSSAILLLCLAIGASFGRSDDGLVKFVMVCFLLVGTNLGLCLMAGKNLYNPGRAASLLDAATSLFSMGVGQLPLSCRGLGAAFRKSGSIGRKSGAILAGLGISLPVLLIIVPLLIQADAAFEGLLANLPKIDLAVLFITALWGFGGAFVLYTRGLSLHFHREVRHESAPRKGLSPLTVNTLLAVICIVYGAYLASQLAYFFGGFSGILPEEFTLAEYARRGFFEMAWLCAINLAIMIFSLSLCGKTKPVSLATRLLCLFIGLVTLLLVATASAKMLLYIGAYGLTRLRLLTQVVMVFLGIVTLVVSIWLFVPRLPYMKIVVLMALLLGAAVSWADVDTQVASYNVHAYLSGRTDTVDVGYLDSLGDGVVPHLVRLTQEAEDAFVRQQAKTALDNRWVYRAEDFRGLNYVNHAAAKLLPEQE